MHIFGKYYIGIFFVIISVFFISGCATLDSTSNTFSTSLGSLEQSGFQNLVERLQSRYQYEIERNHTYTNNEIQLRTYWKKHRSFDSSNKDETEPEEVETRIILTTQKKNSQGYQLYRVQFTGEYRALLPTESGGMDFQRVEMSEGAKNYFEALSSDLEDRVRGSIQGNF